VIFAGGRFLAAIRVVDSASGPLQSLRPMIARDAVAADQLVYAYPYSVGPAVDVSCGTDEVVVLCPAWAVGGMLGPGRHQWQSPEPGKPLAIYFVLTGPVEVPFDMVTGFTLPGTGLQLTVRATGSVLVRVADPGMLIAQFVGLPFDRVNAGLTASVATSVERLLGKVLPRKIAIAGSPRAVTDPSMWAPLADELSAYNPATGAVYGVQFVRFASLEIAQVGPNLQPIEVPPWAPAGTPPYAAPAHAPPVEVEPTPPPPSAHVADPSPRPQEASGWIGGKSESSGMIGGKAAASGMIGGKAAASGMIGGKVETAGEIGAKGEIASDLGGAPPEAVGAAATDPALVVVEDVASGPPPAEPPAAPPPPPAPPATYPAGTAVLVALADGLLHAGTVRQAMDGYYELEIGGADTPLWVHGNAVTPQL
jgi:hypothetical protein